MKDMGIQEEGGSMRGRFGFVNNSNGFFLQLRNFIKGSWGCTTKDNGTVEQVGMEQGEVQGS